jgi:hypothetical protein
MKSTILSRFFAISAVLTMIGCGGDKGTTFTEPPPPIATTIEVQGSGQIARIGQALPVSPTVIVKDQSNAPMSGVSVTFAVSGGGGALSDGSATTNASGVATLPTWTLGTVPGANTVTATAVGGSNPNAQILATARPPRWTFLVYMAADNNLAPSGVGDIDEMEAAGSNPEVQVVIQAEFNQASFSQVGLSPTTVHIPSYNTFRYAFGGLTSLPATHRLGPDGTAVDIGNQPMTDPAQLRDFINWGKQNYPAERYAVVLWNHGGGYSGLLSDETSTPGKNMTLPELKAAISNVGSVDLIDFDMCLMGGYETLVAVNGVAKFAAFSEEEEPGEGDSYTPVLQGLYANPTMDGRALATKIVDSYDASYLNNPASTTKSAYDLAGLPTFESALASAAQTLTTNIASLAPTIATSAARSQKFYVPLFTDISDLIDSLTPAVTDPAIRSQLAALKTQTVTSGFRITSRARNGTSSASNPVAKASGLSIVLPSGVGDDWFWPTGYPLSLDAYQTAMPNKPWAQFLTAYNAQITAPAATYVDLGVTRWELYLVWDTAAVSRNADLDLWIVEPNGNLYIPYLGTVTANGALSSDSEKDHTYFEGYLMNRYVQTGRYWFYANLYTDPQNFQPVFDIQYRQSASTGLSSLYVPNYPRLSMQTSWLSDPTPTFDEANAGSYTDLVLATYLDITAASGSANIVTTSNWNAARMNRTLGSTVTGALRLYAPSQSASLHPVKDFLSPGSSGAPRLTSAQLKTLRINWSARELRRRAAKLSRSSALPFERESAARVAPLPAALQPRGR